VSTAHALRAVAGRRHLRREIGVVGLAEEVAAVLPPA
jgi:hypothetical protein